MPLNSCIVVLNCSSSDFRLKKNYVSCACSDCYQCFPCTKTNRELHFPVLKPTGNFILVVPIFLLQVWYG
jgi:hypothetical protein